MVELQIQELISKFGNENRQQIRAAIKFLDDQGIKWQFKEPREIEEYIRYTINRKEQNKLPL